MPSTPNGAVLEHPTGSVLAAYGHGQLDDVELVAVDAHLSECDECRQVVEGVVPDTLLTLLRSAATDADDVELAAPNSAAGKATLIVPPQELLAHPRYKVGELLGIGGMGAVYKAEHQLMERPVALKVLDRKLTDNPATTDRFRREVRAAARLTHPHIVAAFDAEQAGDVHFLVMEFVDGVSLARRLAEKGPLPVEEACDFIRQAALGLQHAHERGMVHRDIKPQNLMLTPAGQVKILDFGLARFVMECVPGDANISLEEEPLAFGKESMAIRLTHTGLVMGTPDYIAPEQARDSHLADIRADIYSLGCTLYELLAGQSPFPEGKAVDKVRGHLSRTPQPLDQLRRDVPPELLRIVERMMAKEPANRFQTPADVAAALTPLTAAPPPPRKSWKPAIAACLSFFVFLLAGAVIYIQTDNGRIVVETDDDTIAVMIQKAGGVKIVDQANGREYHLRPGEQAVRSGEYLIDVSEPLAGLEFQTKRFELKRGKEVRLSVKLERQTVGENRGIPSVVIPRDSSESAYRWMSPEFWRKELEDPDERCRLDALKAIAELEKYPNGVPAILRAGVYDPSPTVAKEAAMQLTKLGIVAYPFVLEFMGDKRANVEAVDVLLDHYFAGGAHAPPPIFWAELGKIKGPERLRNCAVAQLQRRCRGALPEAVDFLGVLLNEIEVELKQKGPNAKFDKDSPLYDFTWRLLQGICVTGGHAMQIIDNVYEKDPRRFEGPVTELVPLWREAYTKLRKEYPAPRQTPLAVLPSGTSANEGTYQGKPASYWLKQLDDGDPKFRAEAVKALGGIAQKNPKLIPILVGALGDPNDLVGEEAAEALRDLGEAAYPAIIDILQHRKNEAARIRMATALVNRRVPLEPQGAPAGALGGALGGGGVGGLAAAPFPANAYVSGFAAAPLPLLLDTLNIHDDDIRAATIKALGRHGEKAKVAIPRLVEFLGLALDKLEDGVAKGTPIPDVLLELPYHVLDAVVAIEPTSSKHVPKEALKIPESTAAELKEILPKWRNSHRALSAVYPSLQPVVNEIERKLNLPITLKLYGVPWPRLLAELQIVSGIDIVPDLAALSAEKISLDRKVDTDVIDVPARTVLDSLVNSLKITYRIKGEVLEITTHRQAQTISGSDQLNLTSKQGFYQGKPASYWLKQLEDGDPEFGVNAIKAIGTLARTRQELLPTLEKALKNPNLQVAVEAAHQLTYIGPPAYPTILKCLKDKTIDKTARESLVYTNKNKPSLLTPPRTTAFLVEILKLDDYFARGWALSYLKRRFEYPLDQIKPDMGDAVIAFAAAIDALEDSRTGTWTEHERHLLVDVAYGALRTAFKLEPSLGPQLREPINLIDRDQLAKDKSPETLIPHWRKAANELLRRYPPAALNSQSPGPTFAKAESTTADAPLYLGKPPSFWQNQFRDTAPKFRVEAIEALGNLAMKDKTLIPAVVAGLNDPVYEVGQMTAAMLRMVGPEAVPAILAGVDRKSPMAMRHAADAIALYFAKGKDATPLLIDALKMDDWGTRRSATAALLRIGPDAKSSLPALVDLMGVSLATKEIAEQIDSTARLRAEGKSSPFAKLGPARAMPIEILEAILFIDPDVKGALPEGIHNAGKVRISTGINLGASLELWRQTHDALKKRYPK